ncbi:MAG TPA: HAD family phosphatase [Bryobacteraceae bacterium]|nr:HAD family phosphatase [Bryobacteraceae bacterium]
MIRYEAVLFDFDGVVVDSEPVHYECWLDILKSIGIELDWKSYSENCIGITDRAMLAYLCSRTDPPFDIETLALEYPRKKELFRNRMGAIGVPGEIRELFEELRPDYKLAVVTSSNIREVESILDGAGITPLLDTVVHGGEVARHKPAPDPYLLAMERLNVKSAIAVEDSVAGVASARAAGLDVVVIPAANEVCSLVRAALK